MDLRSFHNLVNFTTLSPYLGFEVPSAGLFRARCPMCGISKCWSTTYDNSNGGDWHHCESCCGGGHVVDLLLRRFDLSAGDLGEFLRKRCKIPVSDRSVDDFFIYRNTLDTFGEMFQVSRSCLQAPDERQRQLLNKLELLSPTTVSAERWYNGPGKLFGVMNRETAKAFPCDVPNMRNFVLVPFYLTPQIVHRIVAVSNDRVYDMLPPGSDSTGYLTACAGYQFAGVLRKVAMEQYVVAPMLTALQLNVRQMSVDPHPLPFLTAYSTHATTGVMPRHWFPSESITRWAPSLTASALAFAMHHNGKLVVGFPGWPKSPRVTHLHTYLHTFSPLQIYRQILEDAKPWEVSMRKWWSKRSREEKFRFVDECEVHGGDAAEFVRGLTRTSRRPLPRRICLTNGSPRTYFARSHDVTDERGSEVFGFLPRIRYVVADGVERKFVGSLRTFDRNVRFCIEATANASGISLNREAFSKFLRKHDLLRPTSDFVDMPRLEDILHIGTSLSRAPFVSAMPKVGWHKSEFRFRTCRIGKTIRDEPRRHRFARNVPGIHRRDILDKFDLCDIEPNCIQGVMFWVLLTLLTSQVSGISVNLPHRGIVFRPDNMRQVLPYLRATKTRAAEKNEVWLHDWPYLKKPGRVIDGNSDLYLNFFPDPQVHSSYFASVTCTGIGETPTFWVKQFVTTMAKTLSAIVGDPLQVEPSSWIEWVAYTATVIDGLTNTENASRTIRDNVSFLNADQAAAAGSNTQAPHQRCQDLRIPQDSALSLAWYKA